MVDIPIYESDLTEIEEKNIKTCFEKNFISSQGDFVKDFEKSFANAHGLHFGLATSNCTVAIHLVLLALGIGAGDEVICPALTFIAPINMVKLTGATPVLCDVGDDDLCLNANKLREKITAKTRAIIVVHAFGQMADMVSIKQIADEYAVPIIEDNAESPFARRQHLLAGTVGIASTFSFFGNKIFTTGEGGMVLTDDSVLASRMQSIRDHGMSLTEKYIHVELGTNYRMTNLQAAVGCGQLSRKDEILEKRARLDRLYYQYFNSFEFAGFYREVTSRGGSAWLATITFDCVVDRDRIRQILSKEKIDSRIMVYPVNHAPYYNGYFESEYDVASNMSYRSLHLPSGNKISEEQVGKITGIISDYFNA